MENQNTQIVKHKCNLCEQLFETEDAYIEHTCPVTSVTPQDPQHFGPEFKNIAASALLRGNTKQALVDAGYPLPQAELITQHVTNQEQVDQIIKTFIKK